MKELKVSFLIPDGLAHAITLNLIIDALITLGKEIEVPIRMDVHEKVEWFDRKGNRVKK